jgi:site-specific DNA recombinase
VIPAVAYLRVSTVEQARRNREPEGYSIPAQRDDCQRKAQQIEAEIVREFVDRGASARSAARPELQAMLAFIKEQPVRYVIVHKLDRLARNLADHVQIMLAIRQAGAELVSVVEQIDDTPQGQYMETIFAANAQLYSANLSFEAKKGLYKKARLGGTPTAAPIGYLNVRMTVEGTDVRTVEIDPKRAPYIRWAFQAYATGAYTIETLRGALERRGLVTRPTPTRPEKALGRSQVARMLAHPYYVGIVRYGGAEYEGRHEPLIDKDTFSRAQAILSAHQQAGEKDRKHRHYLKGSVYCGQCGSRMTYARGKSKTGRLYWYFACVGRIIGTGCQQPYVAAHVVEDKVAAEYAKVRQRQVGAKTHDEWLAHLETVREKLHSAIGRMEKANAGEVKRQRERVGQIKARQRKLLDLYTEDGLSKEMLAAKQRELTAELADAEHILRLAQIDREDLETALGKALDLAARMEEAYGAADAQTRRQWNQALFERFEVHADEITDAPMRDEFAVLLDRGVPARLDADRTASGTPALFGQGSKESLLAEREGFEPSRQGLPAHAISSRAP